MKNDNLLQQVSCMHCHTQCPQPCNRPPLTQQHLPPETPGHSQASLSQSIVGSLLFSPGSWCTQGFVCALQKSVSPVLCKFWQLYGGVNCDLLQQGLCHSQVCFMQSLCPCGRPLLTHTSTGDTQTLKGRSSTVSVESPGAHKVLFEPSKHLWQVWGLILSAFCSSCHLAGVSPLPLNVGYLFLVGSNIFLWMVIQQ